MSSKRQQPVSTDQRKLEAQPFGLPRHEMPDDRYPGSFFRVPGIPAPGKTTWSVAK